MAPNVNDLADSTVVGDFEAESAHVNAINRPLGEKRSKKMVHAKGVSMDATLPEQGSWHYERKKAILAKHPEVKSLYGHNPWSFLLMLLGTSAHTLLAISLVNASWWVIIPVTYTLGTYLSWFCMVLGHEGSHGLVFSNKSLNKLHTILAFLPVFLGPFGVFWSIEHMYHHQVVVDKMNRYGPQQAPLAKKLLFSLLFISFLSVVFVFASLVVSFRALLHFGLYALGRRDTPLPARYNAVPFKNFPQVVNNPWFLLNMVLVFAFHGLLTYQFGLVPMAYFFLSNGFCNGLHPLGMRQVQEHYIQVKGQPTNSVYSSLSPILLNIGFHVEHHDFPSIPWNRLPLLKKMAPEFYEPLFSFTSYTQVLWIFLTTPGIPYTSLLEDYSFDLLDRKSVV